MRPPSRKRRTRRATHSHKTPGSALLSDKVPALSGELVKPTNSACSLFLAANLWQFGDWSTLSEYGAQNGRQNRKTGKIALLSASANLQKGATERASHLLAMARKSGCSDKDIVRILVAGAHLNLGRASFLAGRPKTRHIAHFKAAAQTAFGSEQAASTARVIEAEQLSQLGAPMIWRQPNPVNKPLAKDVDRLLESLSEALPEEPVFKIASAEWLQRRGQNSGAIRSWQKAAELLGEHTPQVYYDRLKEAYRNQGSFPAGKPTDEQTRGKVDKYAVLKELHCILEPKLYLEIGVQTGKSLALAECDAIGVDPMPMISVHLPPTTKIVQMTSDEFFAQQASAMLTTIPELVFIDGMHLFEYALRDFMNVESYSNENTVVVIDDIFPNSLAQASRERITKAWAGDVWKVFDILVRYRKDLDILPLDSNPTGVLLVSNLSPGSTVLADNYTNIIEEYTKRDAVDAKYLNRECTMASSVSEALERLTRT